MTIKILSGSLVAAMGMLVLSAPAMADDCDILAGAIETWANDLACDDSKQWVDTDGITQDQAIWQYRGRGSLGCAVHAALAKKLFVVHDEPPKNRGKGKGFRLAQGAANALFDHEYEEALLHLQEFWDEIEYSVDLNKKNPDAAAQADAQQALAMDFMSMIDPVLGCTTP